MSKVFAFGVAKPAIQPPGSKAIEGYDPQRQQLVWQGNGEASLGWPLCTGGSYWGHNPCHTTSTACYGTNCDTSGYLGCYSCDYG